MDAVSRKTRQALFCLTYAKYQHLRNNSGQGEQVDPRDFTEVFNVWKAALFKKMAKINVSATYQKSQAFNEVIQAIRQSRESFAVSSLSVAQDTVIFLLQKFSECMGEGLIDFSKENIDHIQCEVQKMLGVTFTE